VARSPESRMYSWVSRYFKSSGYVSAMSFLAINKVSSKS
jgi:hypothetical protein